ncbi:hypothetical protein [Streptomyces sp. NPDC001307]|uniref:hypothetical protein n=1 Tax=Streptomyces sp. NPDC001307 TaxID=3364560 RepID=UPI0036AF46F7
MTAHVARRAVVGGRTGSATAPARTPVEPVMADEHRVRVAEFDRPPGNRHPDRHDQGLEGRDESDAGKVKTGTVEAFTTDSGLKGTLGTAWSMGVMKSKKCVTHGKAWVFAFKNATGDLVSWSFFGARNVSGEVPDATIRKVAATVRLYKAPSDF